MRRYRIFSILAVLLAITAGILWRHSGPALAQSCPEVQNTPKFTIVWGAVQWNGQDAPIGTVIEARTPAARGGDTVGCFVVTSVGDYGMMFIYGEDTSVSPTIPGMRTDETIEFFINDTAATADPAQTWSGDKDVHQVNLTASGSTAPTAAFSGTPTSGTAPLAVQFTDASSGEITSWQWDFGDGTSGSTQADPSHIYTSAGVYTVELTVSGPGGSDTLTKTDYITVNSGTGDVTANFSGTPTSGAPPLVVNFTDQSVGSISLRVWDFGDGGFSTAQNPSHTYTTAGVYTVTLAVSGAAGSDTITKANYITVNAPTTADFSGTPTSGAPPLSVSFTDQSTGNITLRVWDFGDGGYSTQENPNHTYNNAGVYTVTLTVSGAAGTDTVTKTNYITVSAGSDSDGVDDSVEDAAPNNGDGNDDGTPDKEQAHVTSLPDALGNGEYLTLTGPDHATLKNVRAIAVPAGAPAGVEFPQGLIEFEVEGLSPGEAITMSLILHGGAQPNVYWKYGKTSGTPTTHWYKFNYDNTTGATFAGSTVTLYFVDGQRGDDDLSADGRIVEPGGAGIETSYVYLPVILK